MQKACDDTSRGLKRETERYYAAGLKTGGWSMSYTDGLYKL